MAHDVAKAATAVMAQLTAVKAACSEFGFCGTTKDFCGDKCQSNCVLHPKPPGGSATGKTLSKVIGYYEAWNARSKCHGTVSLDLPISALTHLNYAFAFIDASTFELTTMDAATPVSLFDDIASLKDIKPSLQIYISVGGWTFSDNNTATQPVFGNIARSLENREKFANNALAFLNQYGFDGIDIDWEYPGAPDRGGHKDDTKNYVEMMKTLRQVFDKSGRKLGITFTGPSSFWYMRWFDLPGLLKYADWMNLMSYDLYGVGSIAQAHTNLTEIKLAAELLWRVKVDPSQVALGFGFYGRAFTLQDPLKASIAMFNYLNDAVLRDYLDKARAQLLREITYTDAHAQGLKGILDIWLEFEPAYYARAVTNAHNFVVEAARIINAEFPTDRVDGNKAAAILVTTANQLIKSVYQIKFNPNE
ncbi:hypothetical protein H109_04882 [Trichophyton interdigitale MR816]|uniref:chitinase n=1 Tax=Trichophyton interdigitale (strain MR816) TaxID=1215338 RepID=A0A059J6E6_TRIIM|nr:hypothetical protein H101_00783 [Trichophyton interdigitale H6]KDB23233.1 hypothetical protein H109_04882 [Trichophyton interdigitale MR816]